jgi:CDP-diacylglycerol--glycerol-3-phosphate 3-phosphatidyltransferase/cardiolipin synthase
MAAKVSSISPRTANHLVMSLIAFRFMAALPLMTCILMSQYTAALMLLLLALLTDFLDGRVARWADVGKSIHPFADATADFTLVMAGFTAFVMNDVYPVWMLIIFATVFTQFVLTSRRQRPIYDPVGKYWGVFLFMVMSATLLMPTETTTAAATGSVIVFTCVALLSRIRHLLKHHQSKKSYFRSYF